MHAPFHNRKSVYPFRLGATSYVFPAGLAANAKALSALVDDIELVLFDVEGHSNLPDPETIRILRSLVRDSALSYTVHFPSGIQLGTGNEDMRRKSMETCLRVFERTLPLEPAAYILHFEGDQRGHQRSRLGDRSGKPPCPKLQGHGRLSEPGNRSKGPTSVPLVLRDSFGDKRRRPP